MPIQIVGLMFLTLATLYAVLTLIAVLVWRAYRSVEQRQLRSYTPPISVLKPLCGEEPNLYSYLRSFCEQHYPVYQIVFGVRDGADPALAIARRLQTEFAALPIDIVVNPQQHGCNHKSSNLINMLSHARHSCVVIADSDTCVQPDYLRTVVAPLQDPGVGLVTCTYQDVPTPLIWSRLGAMYINEWYMPSVLLAWLFGHGHYASGQTLCLRRSTLDAVDGLKAMANQLADDYRLGELVRRQKQRIVLSPVDVIASHHEPSVDALIGHEARWMRTLRALRPRSYAMLFLSFYLPVATFGMTLCAAASPTSAVPWALFATCVIARLGLHLLHRLRRPGLPLLRDLWLIPVRDLLLCWVWVRGFLASRVIWRGREFIVDVDGVMRQEN
jgi:ceramide glucosyltransferase